MRIIINAMTYINPEIIEEWDKKPLLYNVISGDIRSIFLKIIFNE